MTDTPTKARYISRYRELRLVLKPAYNREVEGRVVTMPGQDVRFRDGLFETDSPDIIAALEAHPNFGRDGSRDAVFIRVPDNVKDSLAHRAEVLKSLEDKEKDLKAREDALKEKEARINASAEGGRTAPVNTSSADSTPSDGLEDMKQKDLREVAKTEGVEFKVTDSKASIVAAIRAKRSANGPVPAPADTAPQF